MYVLLIKSIATVTMNTLSINTVAEFYFSKKKNIEIVMESNFMPPPKCEKVFCSLRIFWLVLF